MTTKQRKGEMKMMMELTYTDVTSEMTKEEQLEAKLRNKLVTDKLNEPNKEIDPEYYEWYVENKKQTFNEVYSVEVIKTICFKVETDNGTKYYTTDEMNFDDTWFFVEINEEYLPE